ncbi:beta-phosphoglucomutase family hydrolase [Cytophagaceae bacterium ABcell3]|nr:beta-phosphoglucomutase family hydrolase [Cytophagaceae bacterium ABcell3]
MKEVLERTISAKEINAVIFDMDGVVTDTATLHMAAWKKLFNNFLDNHYPDKKRFTPTDYYNLVNGISRLDGIRNFIASRNINLPDGSPSEERNSRPTVHSLAYKKNKYFKEILNQKQAEVFQDTIALIKQLKSKNIKTGLISASKNAEEIVEKAGIKELFDIIADGKLAAKEHIKGKPAPDIFLYAAKSLKVKSSQAAIAEDASSGIKAAKAGAFKLVIGVDREGKDEMLYNAGADIVINNFNEIKISD